MNPAVEHIAKDLVDKYPGVDSWVLIQIINDAVKKYAKYDMEKRTIEMLQRGYQRGD